MMLKPNNRKRTDKHRPYILKSGIMNKYELACLVAKDTKRPIAEVIPVVNSLFTVMADTLLEGEKITVAALGTFSLKTRKQRQGYDPYRRVPIIVPESMSLKFEISPSIQERIREKYPPKIISDKAAETAER